MKRLATDRKCNIYIQNIKRTLKFKKTICFLKLSKDLRSRITKEDI